MPIHDWSRVRSGVFHHFHQAWTMKLAAALNKDVLPAGYFAMADQFSEGFVPDVLTLERFPILNGSSPPVEGGIAVAEAPPTARFTYAVETDVYAEKADRIIIREPEGQLVGVIEIVSPGNKSSRHALEAFVEKACAFMDRGIHMLIVDLFPPSERDPQGIHQAIWERYSEEPFSLPSDKPLTVVAYTGSPIRGAYVDPVAVGDRLPSAAIFLSTHRYVKAPLESTYQAAWDDCPEPMRALFAS